MAYSLIKLMTSMQNGSLLFGEKFLPGDLKIKEGTILHESLTLNLMIYRKIAAIFVMI